MPYEKKENYMKLRVANIISIFSRVVMQNA